MVTLLVFAGRLGFLVAPADIKVGQAPVLLSCVAYSTEGRPVNISWQLASGTPVNTSRATVLQTSQQRGHLHISRSILTISCLSVEDAGPYTCTASNGVDTQQATSAVSLARKLPSVEYIPQGRPHYSDDSVYIPQGRPHYSDDSVYIPQGRLTVLMTVHIYHRVGLTVLMTVHIYHRVGLTVLMTVYIRLGLTVLMTVSIYHRVGLTVLMSVYIPQGRPHCSDDSVHVPQGRPHYSDDSVYYSLQLTQFFWS